MNNRDFVVVSNMKNSSSKQKIVNMVAEIMEDVMLVFEHGEKKHPDSGSVPNFLTADGNKCSKSDRGSSILRHAARTFENPQALDKDSNLPELLHLLSSVMIMYIRTKRRIVHPKDEV